MADSQDDRIAFLGTGRMGQPMATRLLAEGYPLVAYNRTLERTEPVRLAGARVASSPEEAIGSSDCVVVMLTDAAAVRQVLLARKAREALKGRTVIQMGTIGPWESQALQCEIEAAGSEYLEAPVMGGPSDAQAGELIAMLGATPIQFDRWTDLLRAFSSSVHLIGPVGSAAALKLALNQLIASLATFSLSLGIVLRGNVRVEDFIEIGNQRGLFAPLFTKKLTRMLEREYQAPNYPVDLVIKDVDLMLEYARMQGLQATILADVRQLLESASRAGWGNGDYSAMYDIVAPER
jgi:3-hydroxyisobutyrate dehydrogenase